MKAFQISILICLLLAAPAVAQDWQYNEDHEVYHNCELIDLLNEEYGEVDIMKFADGDTMNLALFLDRVFSSCAEWNRGSASDAFDDTPAEPETELEVIAALEDHDVYSIDEADCSIMAKDRFEEDLNVSLTGAEQEDMSVDLYLPGSAQPLDMPNVNSYEAEIMGLSVPTRTEWAVGRNFPLGRYTIDVHLGDDSYRFQWLRRSRAVNTIVVTCVDSAVEEAFADELTAETDDE